MSITSKQVAHEAIGHGGGGGVEKKNNQPRKTPKPQNVSAAGATLAGSSGPALEHEMALELVPRNSIQT